MSLTDSSCNVIKAKPLNERKRIINANVNQIPLEILENAHLNHVISLTLPKNYNFEIHKTIWRLKQCECKRVAIQLPEGLTMFAIALTDILQQFTDCEVMVMGDVTYGACCVDDITANACNCHMIIHYGHSCLIPINQMINGIKVLYVFVDIKFDLWHMIETIRSNFNPEEHRIAIAGTIQFVPSIHAAAKELKDKYSFQLTIPQSLPLSKGEVLGCTAPKLKDINTIVFVADGRFHLEALMIANPNVLTYKYDPYNKEITRECYDYDKMLLLRRNAIQISSDVCAKSGTFGIILGTLGRQGNDRVLNNLKNNIDKHTKCSSIIVLMPEIRPEVLNQFYGVDSWVQIACPRLSIDWGNDFTTKPLLTPYELNVSIKSIPIEHNRENVSQYPMDFYASNSLGKWTPNHKCNANCYCDK